MSANTPLEDLLRQACERGVTHLSLAPTPSEDGKTTYWRATATPSTMHKYVSVNDTDPVVALHGVLLGLPKAPKRAAPKAKPAKPADPEPDFIEQAAVTAAVTPEEPQQETIDQWLPRT